MAARGVFILLLLPKLAAAQSGDELGGTSWGPYYPPPPRVAWVDQPTSKVLWRLSAASTVAELSSPSRPLLGASVAFGGEFMFHVSPQLNAWFYGSDMLLEARAHWLYSLRAHDSELLMFGLAFSSYKLWKEDSALRRLRVVAPFSLLLPEVGVALQRAERPSLYLRWSAPAALLLSREFAVELIPALGMLQLGRRGSVELLGQFSLSLSWRSWQEWQRPRPI